MNDEKRTIIFFDGVCHLCNSFVDFVVRRDPQHRLFFAPLQGETAAKILPPDQRIQISTVLLFSDKKIWTQSTAILKVFGLLGGWTKVFVVFYLVPTPIRDFLYVQIAKHRYQLFGKRTLCRLPEESEKAYLLP